MPGSDTCLRCHHVRDAHSGERGGPGTACRATVLWRAGSGAVDRYEYPCRCPAFTLVRTSSSPSEPTAHAPLSDRGEAGPTSPASLGGDLLIGAKVRFTTNVCVSQLGGGARVYKREPGVPEAVVLTVRPDTAWEVSYDPVEFNVLFIEVPRP